MTPEIFTGLDAAALQAVMHDNWFLGAQKAAAPPARSGARQGR
jgi:hypothetical protein